ncbi:MmgE/PrpD family protein [Acuticoccus sp. 2012]|uniref:MmgE/PrpD family protein n=2 Tax=Acuticoccus mangrovi TaxID=2796142 RepID=A0A934IP96_9HYPH|nr:MmgE/PrpD family protein [Acuticoccus mangrovi]MBJ3778546.1 MmgE/PrpD family protein [Acuticoccus mangrovi]
MNQSRTATETLAEWGAQTPGDWTPACRHSAKRAFIDTVACMFAGAGEPVTQRTSAAVGRWGSGPARRVGGGGQAAPWAALVNGTAAHALDYDDVLQPALAHISAGLVPAILALAEETGDVSGARCLDAYVVGIEIAARLGEALNISHYSRGWHTTLSIGAPAVAAACARLIGLDAGQTAHALALSTSMAGGSKRQFGSMAKPLHAGLAAKNGLVAASLAAAGVDAARDVFEGEWGLLGMTADPDAPGFAGLERRLEGPAALEQHGLWVKAYPACASGHRPIEAAIALHDRGVLADDVDTLTAHVSPMAKANLRFVSPETPSQAKFSLTFCVGAALIDGHANLATFQPERIGRPDIASLAERMRIEIDPALEDQAMDRGEFDRCTVEVLLRDGTSATETSVVPAGFPGKPLSDAALRQKFLECTGRVLGASVQEELWGALETFDRADGPAAITRFFAIP